MADFTANLCYPSPEVQTLMYPQTILPSAAVSCRRMPWETAPRPGTEFPKSVLKYNWWLEILTSEVNVLSLTVIKKK